MEFTTAVFFHLKYTEDLVQVRYPCRDNSKNFSFSFQLPPNVDPDSVQASYENGVLKVVVDKTAPSAQEKKIEIK